MKKGLKLQILLVICILAMTVPIIVSVRAAEPDRYGYSLLTNENQRLAYRELADGIGGCKSKITFEMENVTQDTLNDVLNALSMISKDYPEYFWFSGGGSVESYGNTVTVTPTQYVVAGSPVSEGSSLLQNAKAALDAAINLALAQIPAGASDYQKTEILHDYLAKMVTYGANSDDQTAYGALVQGRAVCAGYTRAYQYLLYKAGIRSWYVSGQSYSPDGQLVNHAWNLVWLGGNCYYTDVTWDDQGDRLFHHYLNLSLEQMQAGHITADTVPSSCGHTAFTYFKMNAAPGKGVCDMTGSESGGDIAKYFILRALSGEQAVYTCDLHYHGADFNQWINGQITAMADALNLTGQISYSYGNMGLEYQVVITGTVKNPADVPSIPSGSTDTPPVGTQPQTQPTQQPEQTQPSQPNAVTTPPPTTDPTTNTEPAATDPTTKTEPVATQPTGASTPGDSTETTAPTSPSAGTGSTGTATGHTTGVPGTTVPSDLADTVEPDTFPVMLIAISVVVILAGLTVIILICKRRK